ncbi:17357_t:CDS:1, partial [Acaulospora colombiana]
SLWAVVQADKRFHRIGLPIMFRRIIVSSVSQLDGFLEMLIHSSYPRGLVKSLWLGWASDTLINTPSPQGSDAESVMVLDEDEDISIEDIEELFNDAKISPLPNGMIPSILEERPWIKSLLVLHLLPNLEDLRIAFSTPRFEGILSQMMQRRLLSTKLRVVRRTAVQGVIDADVLVPSFLYPSVTEIYGHRIVSSEMELQCDWLLPRGTTFSSVIGTSNVDHIELHESRLDTDVIEGILQLPRALRTLVYSDAGTEYERMK